MVGSSIALLAPPLAWCRLSDGRPQGTCYYLLGLRRPHMKSSDMGVWVDLQRHGLETSRSRVPLVQHRSLPHPSRLWDD